MTSTPTTDPRTAALAELAQQMITQYTELATAVASHLPDAVRAEMTSHTRTVAQEAQDRYTAIVRPAQADQ